jgi:hypothetical protein
MTPRKAAKSVGFANRQVRYVKPSVGLASGLIGRFGQCLKAAYAFWQRMRWLGVLGWLYKHSSLLSGWLY